LPISFSLQAAALILEQSVKLILIANGIKHLRLVTTGGSEIRPPSPLSLAPVMGFMLPLTLRVLSCREVVLLRQALYQEKKRVARKNVVIFTEFIIMPK